MMRNPGARLRRLPFTAAMFALPGPRAADEGAKPSPGSHMASRCVGERTVIENRAIVDGDEHSSGHTLAEGSKTSAVGGGFAPDGLGEARRIFDAGHAGIEDPVSARVFVGPPRHAETLFVKGEIVVEGDGLKTADETERAAR